MNISAVFRKAVRKLEKCSSPKPIESGKKSCIIKELLYLYHHPWFQAVLQSNSNKPPWYWHEDRHVDQWNRTE